MNIIKSSEQISELFSQGKRVSSKEIRIIYKKQDEQRGPRGRVAFIAGKKLGNAVVRNRSKRVMRAAAHEAGLPCEGYDILLMATPETRLADHEVLCKSLDKVLRRGGLR